MLLPEATTFFKVVLVPTCSNTFGLRKPCIRENHDHALPFASIGDMRFAFDEWLDRPVASLLERAGGPRTIGLHAWYRHSNEDAWSSFKVQT